MIYLAVDRGWQGQGNGTAMMMDVIAAFADIGARSALPMLVLTPLNAQAGAFYEGFGFTRHRGGGMYLPLETAIDAVTDR